MRFLNLFFFHGTKQDIAIFWLIYICRLAFSSKLACYMSKFMRKLEGRFPDLPEFFRWDTHLYMSLFLSTCLSVHPSHTIFFRNHCDHNFWYTCVNSWYLQVIFFFIFVFIYFFLVVRGVTEQKISQNEKYKLHLSCLVSQEQFRIWSFYHDFWYIYVTWQISRHFFHFFKIFLFLCCYWGKSTKNGLKW